MANVAELREQIEVYRQRELTDLRERLAKADEAADHYRAEAERNAALGRQIATEYQSQVTELKAKIAAYEQANGRDVRAPGR